MCNKVFKVILSIICTWGVSACTQNSSTSSNVSDSSRRSQTSVAIANGRINISDETMQSYNLQIKIGDGICYTTDINANQDISLLDLLKSNPESYYDIALMLAQNNGNIDLNLISAGVLDTTITYHLDIEETSHYSTKVLQGTCAKLSGKYDADIVEGDIIKWLFRKSQKNVGEETINNMRLYLRELNRMDFDEYVTNEAIPVVTSFKGVRYKVTSDLVADNYYLFACNTQEEVEAFVEEMVSRKFDGAVHSLKEPISCYKNDSDNGVICIFLIGIDNNWSYRIAPVGLACIDNIKPSLSDGFSGGLPRRHISGNKEISFIKHRIVVRIPDEVPPINGYASLGTTDFGGNGVSCVVNFVVSFSGDVKTLTLKREGPLTEWLGKATKTIDLQKETSPYIFTFELHLEDGDNYVPVILTDLRGNTTEFKYNVPASFTYRNEPSINIDNEVNLFN